MAGIEYTSIDEVVNDFQLLMDDTSYDKEAQIYQLRLLALQGLRELKFDTEQEVKTIEASVGNLSTTSTHLSIALPDDYVKMLRIGYKGDDGNFHPFSTNPNLSLDASVSAQVNDDSLNENNPYYHTDLGKKYGQDLMEGELVLRLDLICTRLSLLFLTPQKQMMSYLFAFIVPTLFFHHSQLLIHRSQ